MNIISSSNICLVMVTQPSWLSYFGGRQSSRDLLPPRATLPFCPTPPPPLAAPPPSRGCLATGHAARNPPHALLIVLASAASHCPAAATFFPSPLPRRQAPSSGHGAPTSTWPSRLRHRQGPKPPVRVPTVWPTCLLRPAPSKPEGIGEETLTRCRQNPRHHQLLLPLRHSHGRWPPPPSPTRAWSPPSSSPTRA